MYKKITEKPKGYMRPITHSVLFCDRCMRRINWCVAHPKGDFCEDCLKIIKAIDERQKNNRPK